MKTTTTTPKIQISKGNTNTIFELLKEKNTYFDTSVCLFKKTTKKIKQQLIPVVYQKGNMIYKLSYIVFDYKGRKNESLEYLAFATSEIKLPFIQK